jgi:hypothetical protein
MGEKAPMNAMLAFNNMKTNPAFLLLVLAISLACPMVLAEEPERNLPVLTAKVTFAEGSFFGYSPPHAGDTIRMDLGALNSITNGLAFKSSKSSDHAGYIPLTAPLHIERIERDQDGKLLLVRLISGPKISNGTERVIIDIQRHGKKDGAVWIIEENEIVMSVARLTCEFSK